MIEAKKEGNKYRQFKVKKAWQDGDDRTRCTTDKLSRGYVRRKIEIMQEKRELKKRWYDE